MLCPPKLAASLSAEAKEGVNVLMLCPPKLAASLRAEANEGVDVFMVLGGQFLKIDSSFIDRFSYDHAVDVDLLQIIDILHAADPAAGDKIN